ncbi:strictosidine synthase-like [Pistacia vera]|uniref:strictosidine synthase-like n=1 Tax=Pistacia vera TaxID=55513 RepID=UPI00126349E1|nr:strictosidine synthase-like [Pistacia vera]
MVLHSGNTAISIIFGFKTSVMLCILVSILSLPSTVLSIPSFTKIILPPGTLGPESLAFEPFGGAFYTGVADGRILRYGGPQIGFLDYAFTSPKRSHAECDDTTNPDLGPIYGRPFGLALNRTRYLFIADAYYSLLVAGPNGRLATQLAISAEGERFRFCNGLDIDQRTGLVYFTDTSAVYDVRTITHVTGDSTGRLLRYDPKTNLVTVLLRNLTGPAGVAVSRDSSFLLLSEFRSNRTIKYFLTGQRATTFGYINFQPKPNNIKRNIIGNDFWEAALMTRQSPIPIGQRIDEFGNILATRSFEAQYGTTAISKVQPFGGSLYISSRSVNFVGVYRP